MNAAELGVLIPIISVISIFALPVITALILIFKKISSTHNERMSLIEQGIIPPNQTKRKSLPNRYRSLRNGIILVSIGIGLTVGIIGTETLLFAENEPFFSVAASTVLFLGIGYLVFFGVTRKTKDYSNSGLDDSLDSELDDDAE